MPTRLAKAPHRGLGVRRSRRLNRLLYICKAGSAPGAERPGRRERRIIDLVFYNRLLRCFVLIDLKTRKLTHQDIGQMQMYVNHYDRNEKTEDENPTIGILLCTSKNDTAVRLALPENNTTIYTS